MQTVTPSFSILRPALQARGVPVERQHSCGSPPRLWTAKDQPRIGDTLDGQTQARVIFDSQALRLLELPAGSLDYAGFQRQHLHGGYQPNFPHRTACRFAILASLWPMLWRHEVGPPQPNLGKDGLGRTSTECVQENTAISFGNAHLSGLPPARRTERAPAVAGFLYAFQPRQQDFRRCLISVADRRAPKPFGGGGGGHCAPPWAMKAARSARRYRTVRFPSFTNRGPCFSARQFRSVATFNESAAAASFSSSRSPGVGRGSIDIGLPQQQPAWSAGLPRMVAMQKPRK